MDSNFQVKVTADISALQSSLKSVEAQLNKLSSSTNNASNSLANMEQNANRGRMVAFAFGQVIRDAGFFSQSFSLGILAISNNIPILIDQLSLSVKVLQPFAGALSLIGSLLTAGLTIWAYSTQGVKKYTDAMSDAKGEAMASAMELNSLLKVARDESNSLPQRQDAVNRLNEKYKEYNGQLAINNINSKKNIETSAKISQLMLLEAEAAAVASEAQLRYSKTIAIRNLPAKELSTFWENIGYQINRAVDSFDFSKPFQTSLKLTSLLNNGVTTLAQGAFSLFDNFNQTSIAVGNINKKSQLKQLDNELKSLESQSDIVQKKITELLMGGKKGATKDSVLQTLKETLTAISLDPSITQLDALKSKIDAYQSALKSLIDEGYNPNSAAVKNITKLLGDLALQYEAVTLKADKLKNAQVKSTTGGLAGQGRLITDEDLAREQQRIENINKQSRAIEALSVSTQNANQWVQHLAQTVGGELVNSFNEMLTTGTFSFESIGKALLDMIKRLAAAAMAAAVLSAILSSLFPGAGNTSFKDVFGQIIGMRFAGGVGATSAPSVGSMTTNGINTSINTANSSSGGGVLETRVSGNDLVILLDRASNNRNKYF